MQKVHLKIFHLLYICGILNKYKRFLYCGVTVMLSKTDIQKEIGKGICIYPLILSNIKENSLNLGVGKYAWSLNGGTVYFDKTKNQKKCFSLIQSNNSKKVTIDKGGSVILSDQDQQKYVVLLPHSTTLIETAETIAIGNNIGGTYHSKVGLVSKGLGHIGTMVGPNFCGDSLVAVHNVSDELIVLKCGETFVSVVFYYLKTKYSNGNATVSGHTDKFSSLGINLTESDEQILNADWKKQKEEIRKRMINSKEYTELQKDLKERSFRNIKSILNVKNIVIVSLIAIFIIGFGFGAYRLDLNNNTTIWSDRFWNVFCSGLAVAIISPIMKYVFNNRKDN